VEVVRLVTKGTVEEQIFALGQSKLLLDGRVAGDSEDSSKMEDAGEKAVARMLLEGTGMSSDADPAVKGEEKKDIKVEKETNKKPEGKKLPQRKKSSILGSMLTQRQDATKTAEEDKKLVKVDGDEEEILV
jgi:SWI/SNF-related matrix-associated actin-dependent regulator 1 of chromatin subfamily A